MAQKLDFPVGVDVYEAPNGVKYVNTDGYWKQELEGIEFFDERFVQVPGDVMTGSLTAPSFTGNVGVEALTELPN